MTAPTEPLPARRSRERMMRVGLVLLLLVNVVWIARNFSSAKIAAPGQRPGDFALPLAGGGETRLADARGHTLVIDFWATWCGPCKVELPALERLSKKYAASGVRFLAVDEEGAGARARVLAFADQLKLTLPIALDDGELGQRFHVEMIPFLVIVDGGGQVKLTLEGLHGEAEIAHAIDQVEAQGEPPKPGTH